MISPFLTFVLLKKVMDLADPWKFVTSMLTICLYSLTQNLLAFFFSYFDNMRNLQLLITYFSSYCFNRCLLICLKHLCNLSYRSKV